MDDDLWLVLIFWVGSRRRDVGGGNAAEDMFESGPAPKGYISIVQSMDGVFSWDAGD